MKKITLNNWKKQFEKLCADYISSVDFNSAVFEDADIGQIGDDMQREAYFQCFNDYDEVIENTELSDWEHYEESCDYRTDFEYQLREMILNWE